MANDFIRRDFDCAHCGERFGYPIPISLLASESAEITVSCPFCGGQSLADLTPWADKSSEVLMGDGEAPAPEAIGNRYHFPERIPTTPVEQSDGDSDDK